MAESISSDLEDQGMVVDGGNRDVEVGKIPVMAFRPSHEAKLRELLHNICLHEIKLCSDAAKEFVKLLKGETGGDLLRLYFQSSPNFAELLEAWKLRHEKQGLSYIFSLIQTILSHPEGKDRSTDIGRAIDQFGRLLVEEKLDDIYKELNSKEGKQQSAALSLLASIVRRGPGMASEIAKKFDFKGFAKLAEYNTQGTEKVKKHSTRKAFVGFAISFLEVGKPGLLSSVLNKKEMYSKVLPGLGKDDDDTVASVLSTLKDKILVEESLISPGLRSVLFGIVTLKHLASISAREDAGIVNELAHDVLVKVCTDPSNGLMPDAKRKLRGNSDRLLMLMKGLRAAEIGYHRDLLLAIVRGRPSLASDFLDEFPYNVEDFSSPSWFSSISLAANLVSSVRTSCSFDFLNPDQRATPPSGGSDVQTIMKCICPRPFSRSLITKGMLHSDFLVKHGTLRFLLETLRLLDSFLTAWNLCSSHRCSVEQIQISLERNVMGEVSSFFPDSQVLLIVLKSLDGSSGTQKLSLKREAELDSGLVGRKKRIKRSEKDVLEEEAVDIVIGGVGSDKDIFLAEDNMDAHMTDQEDAEKEYLGIVSDIWISELCSNPIDSVEEAEMCFHIKLLDALKIYVRAVPNELEGSFDIFMKFLSNSFGMPVELQRALLSLLSEYISWTPKSQSDRGPTRIPPLMHKHLRVFINLLLFSPHNGVKDLAYNLAVAAMNSTGAFENNPSEIGAWFLFLPCFEKIKLPLELQEAVQSMSSVVVSFLCDAVSTVGNNLFKHWDIVRSSLSHLKGVSIGFSPLIICLLQKCVRLLNSESKTSLPEKSAISLYVCSTLKYLLQTQVDSKLLSCLIQSVLSEVVDESKDSLCEWRPLRMLLCFSQSLSNEKPIILHSRRTTGLPADSSFAETLDEIKRLVRSISPDEIAGIVKAFSSALICATPESILQNFASVMDVSWAFYGTPFSFLQSITFLEENFLGNLSKLSPDLFASGSEFTGSGNLCEGTVDSEIDFSGHSSVTEEIRSKMDNRDMESSAFSIFLKQAPFPVLLNAIMSMDISCLPEFPRISELLLLKVSQPKSGSIDSNIQLILFWLFQIRSSYKVQPAPVLHQLSEICLRLMKNLFSQISEPELVSGPSSNKLPASFAKWKHQVAETVLCHPVVMALLESPLDCGTLPPVQNVEIFSETSLTMGRLVFSEIDQHILNLLVSTCEHFLFDEKPPNLWKEDLRKNKSIIAFKDLVERLLLEFRVKFELCVGSQSYVSLLQPAQLIHALLRFISPFKLFNIAHSMLSKIDEEGLTSPNSSIILSLGLGIAGGAFEMLVLYSHQPTAKRGVYDLLWELEEKNYASNIIEKVYSMACKFSTSLDLDSADICLLKVCGGIFRGKHNQNYAVDPLVLKISLIVGRTPEDLIIHCINRASITRAKILFYLVESSPLHLLVFGHFFFSMLSKKQDDSALTDDQFIMLLPAVLSYLTSVIAKLEKPCNRCLDITSVYSNILINGFLQWPRFLARCIFEEKHEEILLSTTEDMETMFNASLIGKAVRMFQYHFSLTESPTKEDDLFKVFNSMFPLSSTGKEMLDYEIKEVDVQSVDQILNVAIRVVAKVTVSRICLFPEDSSMCHLKRAAGTCVKESSSKIGCNRAILSKPLLDALVNSWQCVVKKSDGSFKGNYEGKQDRCWSLCKSLENFILRSILQFLESMCEELVQLDSLPFLDRLMKSVLLYRFEDSKTLKILREIFSLLSRGKYSYAPYIQRLIYHSRFTPTISSLSISSSNTGELFRPVSSILNHLIILSPDSVRVKRCCLEAPKYAKQLEIVKILRVLLSNCGKDSGMKELLSDLHFLLLCSYGATLREIDLEIYKLMHDIKLIEAEQTLNVSETDYLWGKAALKIREGLSQDASDVCQVDLVEDVRQGLIKENLCVDPKICALTVLFFPYQRTTEKSENFYLYDDPINEKCSPVIEEMERYDPAFILHFSIDSLSMGYIEPVEFASLGLLAVAFVSMSSADLGMRKLGYETLQIFLDALENCRKNKHVTGLRLLLMYVQNGVEEPWQRIPTVSAIFAAETSMILLDPSHEHYVPINKLLKSSSTLKLRGIPLFHDFFWSSAVNFRSQRFWELRLVYLGLKSDDDVQIYIKNSILETVISFSSSPLADDETKRLILQVVRKSVKFHKIARHLVENCGLFSWCSSFISNFTTKPIGDKDLHLVVVLEIITDVLASRNITEWLQRFGLEGLMEISSRLYKLLGGGLVSVQENGTSVDLILQILSATLKISQKRNMYQPHFTITIEGIFQLFEGVANFGSPQVEASAESGLITILMSTPPVDILCMDVDKLRRFLLWGTSTALKSDFKKGSKPSESHEDTKILIEGPQEETMVAKFLRWLSASVILGKSYSKASDSDPTFLSKTKPETLLTSLEYFKKRNLEDSMQNSEHIIGEVIVHLQQFLSTNYMFLLPSVVFALSLMLLHNDLGTGGMLLFTDIHNSCFPNYLALIEN
jgi:nucleolar pre-ribosomal-associated protein 1